MRNKIKNERLDGINMEEKCENLKEWVMANVKLPEHNGKYSDSIITAVIKRK